MMFFKTPVDVEERCCDCREGVDVVARKDEAEPEWGRLNIRFLWHYALSRDLCSRLIFASPSLHSTDHGDFEA
jgi:hypothetical protein